MEKEPLEAADHATYAQYFYFYFSFLYFISSALAYAAAEFLRVQAAVALPRLLLAPPLPCFDPLVTCDRVPLLALIVKRLNKILLRRVTARRRLWQVCVRAASVCVCVYVCVCVRTCLCTTDADNKFHSERRHKPKDTQASTHSATPRCLFFSRLITFNHIPPCPAMPRLHSWHNDWPFHTPPLPPQLGLF